MLPAPGAIDTAGLNVTPETMSALFAIDPAAWGAELAAIEEHFAKFGSKLPAALAERLEQSKKAVSAA
jgi:phosphoenolpyruvate carboxykinase (GTP)